MNLSISNIGWKPEQEDEVYGIMKSHDYSGLEIAPTRVFPDSPYDHICEAERWAKEINKKYGFSISSMQSIWYGRQERLFCGDNERENLLEYTKSAIDFAETIKCGNLVFGCPKNRVKPEKADDQAAIVFFHKIGEYAVKHNTVIGMEANPTIYNTNFINDTKSALELIERVGSEGFQLNLDVGTMIQNNESVDELIGRVHLINHVHISEPGLKKIEHRNLHRNLMELLVKENYQRFISIEMGKSENITDIEQVLLYVKEIFG